MDNEIKRAEDGTFPPGVSGNPKGRPKGSKNQITLLKESLELALRTQSNDFMGQVMEKAIELAMQGDRSMIKLLLELHMSKGSSQDKGAGVEKVSININGPSQTKDVERRDGYINGPNKKAVEAVIEEKEEDELRSTLN